RANGTIADLIGYGSASVFEGSAAAPTLNNTTADLRAGSGCTDTDNNSADFTAAAPAPRNSATAAHSCGGSTTSSGTGTTSSSSGGGTITLPSPTLAPVHLSNLVFGAFGDTRPASSTTSGYPTNVKNVINSIFTGLQAQGVPFAVAGGDYAFSST